MKMRERERKRNRTQNSELYYTKIEILGNCLFLQSVLATLHICQYITFYKTTVTFTTTIITITIIRTTMTMIINKKISVLFMIRRRRQRLGKERNRDRESVCSLIL